MAKDFSKNNTHEQNVKLSIDKILGTDTVLKRAKKRTRDNKKIFFMEFIDSMIYADYRTSDMLANHHVDMSQYDKTFYDSIDAIMKLTFSKKQLDIIYFFLYDRINEKGKIIPYLNEFNVEVPLNNPEELWDAIQNIK